MYFRLYKIKILYIYTTCIYMYINYVCLAIKEVCVMYCTFFRNCMCEGRYTVLIDVFIY